MKGMLSKLKTFESLGVIPEICNSLSSVQINTPTSIQKLAIPSLLQNTFHHLVTAQTGTGKTLAYLIPIFQLLHNQEVQAGKILTKPNYPRAMIIIPNRDLVAQCMDMLSIFNYERKLISYKVSSGISIGLEKESLTKGVDIVVGTPERIEQHILNGDLHLNELTQLVVDETDTLLDIGYQRLIEFYTKSMIKSQGKINFFAATLPDTLVDKINNLFYTGSEKEKPTLKKIVEKATHYNLSHIKHEFIHSEGPEKQIHLMKVINEALVDGQKKSFMIFCNTVPAAEMIEQLLIEKGFKAASLSGKHSIKHRTRSIEGFREKRIDFLVCNDLASRGLDFPHLNYVINYEFPRALSDYVHRAGRCGRCGRDGTVISFYKWHDRPKIDAMQESFRQGTPLKIDDSVFTDVIEKATANDNTSEANQVEKLKAILRKSHK